MKRTVFILFCFITVSRSSGQIIADHTAVDDFANIPSNWIDSVKTMFVAFYGESHSGAYDNGMVLLEAINGTYACHVASGELPTDQYVRVEDVGAGISEGLWFTWYSYPVGERPNTWLKDRISEYAGDGHPFSAIGFGWCADMTSSNYGHSAGTDPVYEVHWYGRSESGIDGNSYWGIDADDYAVTNNHVSLATYLGAMEEMITYCESNSPATEMIFTTGPVDSLNGEFTGEAGYQGHLKHEAIRDYVKADSTRILFDYADILSYDNNGTPTTQAWNGHTYPKITSLNYAPVVDAYHISEIGAVRLAKAQWWMLARIAGWDGMRQSIWTGNTGSSWADAANWNNGVPDEFTDVIIPDAATGPVVDAGMEAECYNLEIQEGATLTIKSDVSASGSLIVHGTSSGNVRYDLQMPDDNLYHYISPPVKSETLPSSAIFWAWNEVAGDWGDPVTACENGRGYTMQANNSLVSFTGSAVNAAGSITATSPYADCDFPDGETELYSDRPFASGRDNLANYGGGGWNLLGNPFTSALDATKFIALNDAWFDQNYKALYIYNGSTYSYIGTELTGWENAEGTFGYTYVQAGQGFFVGARCNSSIFSFTSDMQAHASAVPLTKSSFSSDKWPGVLLKAECNTGEAATLIVYNEQMTTGLDPGYDIGMMSTGGGIGLYTEFPLKNNGVYYARQALPVTGADDISVPVGVDLAGGGKVTFSAITEPVANDKFWLEDRETGMFTDLTSHNYTVMLPPQTYGTGRFYIISSVNTPVKVSLTAEEDKLKIWSSSGKIIIKGRIRDGAICEIFDMQGRKLLEKNLSGADMNTIDIPAGFHGVTAVRVTDGHGVKVWKLAIP